MKLLRTILLAATFAASATAQVTTQIGNANVTGNLTFGTTAGGKITGSAGAVTVTPNAGNFILGSGVFTVPVGSATAPSLTFTGQTGTGFHYFPANAMGFDAAGVTRLIFDSSGKIYGTDGVGNPTNYVQLASNGAVNIVAAGTNQSITLTPSGTGSVVLSGTGASPGLLQLPTHTTIAGGVGMGAATSFYTTNVGRLRLDAMTGTDCAMKFALNGTDTLQFAISGGDTYLDYPGTMHFRAGFGGAEKMSLTNAGALTVAGTVTSYNGIATAGNGVASIQGAGRVTAQSAANASVATYTVGASDASFIVSANVNVTTSSAEAFTVTCTYTDETNTSRIMTFNFQILAGTIGTAINFANGAVPYEGVPNHIRCKASTAITIKTAAGGTYTGCVYNAEGVITKLQ